MEDGSKRQELLGLTTEIVASFAGHNAVAMSDLPALISAVFELLRTAGAVPAAAEAEAPVPAVSIRKSIQHDFLVCLEDGKKLKMLKRYLATRYDMTPAQYRERWGLAHDYPMTAPAYAAQRSALAKEIGLGRKPAAEPTTPEPAPAANRPQRRAAGRRKAA